VYTLSLTIFVPFVFSDVFADRLKNQQKSVHGLAVDEFPHHRVRFLLNVSHISSHSGAELSAELSSIISLMMATLVGFLDYVFDIR